MSDIATCGEIREQGLPDGATGIYIAATNWTECRAVVEDLSWQHNHDGDDLEATVLYGEAKCSWLGEIAGHEEHCTLRAETTA